MRSIASLTTARVRVADERVAQRARAASSGCRPPTQIPNSEQHDAPRRRALRRRRRDGRSWRRRCKGTERASRFPLSRTGRGRRSDPQEAAQRQPRARPRSRRPPATSSTTTSSPKLIVSRRREQREVAATSGSSSAIFPTTQQQDREQRRRARPRTIPSITNGQRMNQSVAPTSFITSTSRRRENSDRRIVFEISRTDATTSSTASRPSSSFTTRVATRIFFVSSLRFLTASIAGSIVVRPPPGVDGASASRELQRVVRVVGRDAEGVRQRVGARAARRPRGCAASPPRSACVLGDELRRADVRRSCRRAGAGRARRRPACAFVLR